MIPHNVKIKQLGSNRYSLKVDDVEMPMVHAISVAIGVNCLPIVKIEMLGNPDIELDAIVDLKIKELYKRDDKVETLLEKIRSRACDIDAHNAGQNINRAHILSLIAQIEEEIK